MADPQDESVHGAPDDDAAKAFKAAYADDWKVRLARRKDGSVLPNLANTVCILQHDIEWQGVIGYDEFSGRIVKRKGPPFAKHERGEWTDLDDRRTLLWLAESYAIEPRGPVVFDAIQLVGDRNRFHEVREYLDALVWDGVPRCQHWISGYCGGEVPLAELRLRPDERRTERYYALAGTKWLVQAVARIYEPGCKGDYVLVLEGSQGAGKSTVLKELGGPYFTDAPIRLGDKDALAIMRGKWIVELAELDSLGKAENSAIKAFFSQYVDRYRAHYERRAADIPRQQVFAGTVNHRQWLRDETGGRRFWPVWCQQIALDELRENRDQLWAEAVHLYRSGYKWAVMPEEWELFSEQQDARYVGDAWETRVLRWLREPTNDGLVRVKVTTADVLQGALRLDAGKWSRAEQIRIGIIMQRVGWDRERESAAIDPGRPWVYVKPEGWE